MAIENELNRLVAEIEGLVEAATAEPERSLSGPDLRRVLGFLAKVVLVVDQAFQDVYTTLIEIKYLSDEDWTTGRLRQLQKELDLVLARSRYRDAEEICSRLSHLRMLYETEISPLLRQVADQGRWRQVLWLIEEREGRIIMLVNQTVFTLSGALQRAQTSDLSALRAMASERTDIIRQALMELRSLSNEIIGLSGQDGLLELTVDRGALSERTRIFVNRGAIHMSQDTYNTGQAGAVGPHSHAHDMTFQQVWSASQGQIDLPRLAAELSELRKAMKQEASSTDQDIALGEVAAAEVAASKGDGPKALQHLKAAGKWAFDVATKIGTGVAVVALKTVLGL